MEKSGLPLFSEWNDGMVVGVERGVGALCEGVPRPDAMPPREGVDCVPGVNAVMMFCTSRSVSVRCTHAASFKESSTNAYK